MGALLVTPGGRRRRLFCRLRCGTINGQTILVFLKQLLRRVPGEIVLVWDNHPIHTRRLIKAFIASQTRLHVFYFPSYACPCQSKTSPLVHRKRTHLGQVDNKVFIENRPI